MSREYDINELFSDLGRTYGFSDVEARYTATWNQMITWDRIGDRFRFSIPDYLEDAPYAVMHSLADTLFLKLTDDPRALYEQKTVDYLVSDEFAERNQLLYLSRLPPLTPAGNGRKKDLAGSFGRLKEKGLVSDHRGLYIGWISVPGRHYAALTSVMMRTACINKALDDENVSDELLDFVLFAQLRHIDLGMGRAGTFRGREYHSALESYPKSAELTSELENMGLVLR